MNNPGESKKDKQPSEEQLVKKARMQSFVLGAAAVIAIIFMIYGFTQSIEADRQRMQLKKMTEIKDAEITALQGKLKECEAGKQ